MAREKAVAPELFCADCNIGVVSRETIARNCESSLKRIYVVVS